MRIFILFFLLGAACASPVYDALEDDTDILAHLESSPLKEYLALSDDADEDTKTETVLKLKEHLEGLLNEIKEAIDHGKTLKKDVFQKVKEIKEKLKDIGVEVGAKIRDLLKDVVQKYKDFFKNILEKLGKKETERNIKHLSEDYRESLLGKLQELLGKVLEALKYPFASVKISPMLPEILTVLQEMVDNGIELGGRALEMLQEMLQKIPKSVKYLMDKLGLSELIEGLGITTGSSKRAAEAETDEVKGIRKFLDDILEKIDSAIKKGEAIEKKLVDKAKELIEKLKEKNAELKEKARKLIESIKERAIDYLRKLLEKLDSKDKHTRAVDDEKTELQKKLNGILEKIREAIEKGKEIKSDLIEELKELKNKLKDHGHDIGEKAKEIIKKIRDTAKKVLKDILEKLGFKDEEKRSLEDDDVELVARASAIKDWLRKLREMIETHFDVDSIREKLESKFCKGLISELCSRIFDILNEKGENSKQKLLDVIKKIIGADPEKRSVREAWENVKAFFENIHVHLKERFLKLGEYIKENFAKVLEHIKDKHEALKEIARQLKDHAKDLSKEIAEEAMEFLRPYKEDLGKLYEDTVAALKDIIKKKEE